MRRIFGKKKINWIEFPREEKPETLNNPYCGFYPMFRFYVDSKSNYENKINLDNITIDDSYQICLIGINLVSFNDKPLSEESLTNVNKIFRYFKSFKKQMIVRFLYDWEGNGILHEPKDISYILRHMDQLSPLLKEYENYIYIIQGLFIGSWGEMHNSRFLNDNQIIRLARNLYKASGDCTQIALRSPSYWRMVFNTFEPLNSKTAFNKKNSSRFALYNDGMLASDSDLGTYGEIRAIDSKQSDEKWIRKDELEFQNKLCRYVSNGGEVVNDNVYNDIPQAMVDLREMRVSYLHSNYDENVLNKWRNNVSNQDGIWHNRSAFEYIDAHLGYRFAISDVKVTMNSNDNNNLMILINIENMGFSPCYHMFDIKVGIRSVSYLEFHKYNIDSDTRFWMPKNTSELVLSVSISDLQSENYILCLGIYDKRTKQHIEIANTFSGMDHEGFYSLGKIIIK